jgi:hypothetical protein
MRSEGENVFKHKSFRGADLSTVHCAFFIVAAVIASNITFYSLVQSHHDTSQENKV